MKNNNIKNETFKNIENTLINYLSFWNNSKKQLLENVLCNWEVSKDIITIVNTSRG